MIEMLNGVRDDLRVYLLYPFLYKYIYIYLQTYVQIRLLVP